MKFMKKVFLWVIIPVFVLGVLFQAFYRLINDWDFQVFGGITNRVNTEEKVVALTFDDGPAENTDAVLAELKKHQVKATFFLVGSDLEKNMDKGKKIAAEGHELGNHSYSHTRMVFKSPSFIKEEIEKTGRTDPANGISRRNPFPPAIWEEIRFPSPISESDQPPNHHVGH